MAAASCRDAVVVYSQILNRRWNAEITLQEALDEWTNYVVGCDGSSSSPEVADVLSTLFNCLALSVSCKSNDVSPIGSSAALNHLADAEENPNGAPRGLLHRFPKRRTPGSVVAAHPLAPPNDPIPSLPQNPRRLSGKALDAHDDVLKAPEQSALGDGLEAADCEGFKLE